MNAVLMIARNNLHLTKLAVASVMRQDIEPTLMVVDNASADGTAHWLATKNIATISYTHQKSLAACWNYGLSRLWCARAGSILVVNNDVELLPTTLRLLQSANLPFVTGVSVSSKDQLVSPVVNVWPTATRPHPDFSCFMIQWRVFLKVGPFDEDYYPAYCEDCDYHIRMHRAGIEAVCVDLPFYHAAAQTVKNANQHEQNIIKHGADRNRERFRWAYGCLPGTPEYYDLFKVPPVER